MRGKVVGGRERGASGPFRGRWYNLIRLELESLTVEALPMDAILERLGNIFGLEGPLWLAAAGVSIFLIVTVLAILFNWLIFPLILRFTRWTPTDLDTRLVRATRVPLTLAIVVLGGYLALTLPFDLSGGQQRLVNTIASLMGLILGIMAVAAAVGNALRWYEETVAPRTATNLDQRLVPLLRRIAGALIYTLGALLILDHLGVSISPLIAGLGLGGLAVALALQPTLANLFAGTYVMTEGVVTPGDYIELESGITGYVVDVSWRSTRLRTWGNNLVVIPNSRFAETIITNYQAPVPAVNVYLTCGVSYDSDLYMVERVCKEVMSESLEQDPDAVKEYGSYFGFDSFGDSNVNFWLFLQARDRLASFRLRTALMQRLHGRLGEEGIVINYPVRTLQFPKEWQANRMPFGEKIQPRPESGPSRLGPERRRRSPRPDEEVIPEGSESAPGEAGNVGGPDL